MLKLLTIVVAEKTQTDTSFVSTKIIDCFDKRAAFTKSCTSDALKAILSMENGTFTVDNNNRQACREQSLPMYGTTLTEN